mmetsp:Transcript_1869/g.2060  ORF Transcript_1869/g.2060 Transcript_1869/m.2060 type:complete len:133 (+) Transcript_1869:207-605(+)|eukprot:CAMPEP_0197866610 /NCGR_PEP_ID=MMETSP1438-20131217/44308_1 /TAXON_ID=1461541 /ORGANISM="Pterosperma sp., Strain CCMP1384" /LENGTH=132 /DNA_ID=CAMNT_0043485191 /DNA_START=201 /DNA_END=599 /DNA_ORIENTATION=+
MAPPAIVVPEGFTALTADKGVLKKIIEEGKEAEYEDDDETPPEGAMVSVHYTGSFPETGKVFESSYKLGQPFCFTIGERGVVQGWQVAVPTMKQGEKCVVILSPEYAYGDQGTRGIPGKSTLQFELELVEWI